MLVRRRVVALVIGVRLAVGMAYSLYWGDDVLHAGRWQVPGDLWFTLRSATAYVHGPAAAIYGGGDHLVTLPGILVVLAPVALVAHAGHLSMGLPVTLVTYPTAWVVVGPYEMLVASTVLVAVDVVAERAGVTPRARLGLALVQAVVLSDVDVLWGHPEDALAMALLVAAVAAVDGGRTDRAGWVLGAALAVQPLVVLAVPVVLAWRGGWRPVPTALRLVLPSMVLLAWPLAGAPMVTVHALVDQPNFVRVDHPTPWAALSPALGPGVVAAGPARVVGVGLAVVLAVGVWVWRRHRGAVSLCEAMWLIGVALALRCAFEPVLDPYYAWPAVAALVLCAAMVAGGRRLAVVAVPALGTMVVAQLHLTGPLLWWLALLGGLGVTAVAACPSVAVEAVVGVVVGALGRAYSGPLSCLRPTMASRRDASMATARQIAARDSAGATTASTKPRSAATHGVQSRSA